MRSLPVAAAGQAKSPLFAVISAANLSKEVAAGAGYRTRSGLAFEVEATMRLV